MKIGNLTLILICSAVTAYSQNPDSLFKQVELRMASYSQYDTLRMKSVSNEIECGKRWEPRKITHLEKIVTIAREFQDVAVLTAWEEKKGKRKDTTEKVRKETAEELEKNRNRREEHKHTEACDHEDADSHQMSIALTTMLPDSAERAFYTFKVLKDTLIDDRETVCIRADTEVEADSLYEGLYYFDKEHADILLMDVRPAKYPPMVKSMRMKMQFTVLPGNYFTLKSMRMKAHASIVLKTWRMLIEEEYSDFYVAGSRK